MELKVFIFSRIPDDFRSLIILNGIESRFSSLVVVKLSVRIILNGIERKKM